MLDNVDVDFNRRKDDPEFALRTVEDAFRWASESVVAKSRMSMIDRMMSQNVRNDKQDGLAVSYYRAAGYSDSEIAEKMNKNKGRKDSPGMPADKMLPAATCECANPNIVELYEYQICDNCRVKVTDSDILAANYTEINVSAPIKLIQLDEKSLSSRKGKKKSFTGSNRWSGMEQLIVRLCGQKSCDFRFVWDDILGSLRKHYRRTESLADITFEELFAIVERETLYGINAPVIWEAITGHPLPKLDDSVLEIIRDTICPTLKLQDEEFMRESAGKYSVPSLKPACLLVRALHLCGVSDFDALLAPYANVNSVQKADAYWEMHCKRAGWIFKAESVGGQI
jgi:hypothetical protein